MKVLTVALLLLFVAFSGFALLNWSVIAAPTVLSIGFATVQAPLGVVLLAGSGLLTATFLVFVAYHQAAALVAARRFARDLEAERKLAKEAEASRVAALRTYLDGEFQSLRAELGTRRPGGDAQAGRLEQLLVTRLTEEANGLSAHLAEIEDKLDRVLEASPR